MRSRYRPGYRMPRAAGLLCLLLGALPWHDTLATPSWIEHASKPGPDIAAVGQSRFDQLFLQPDKRYRIPYPFGKLVENLESRLDNGANPAVRRVFVPIGRSLQRDTPAPDYFRFPREVIALEGEPVTTGREAGLVMEYRLFIAHQPATGTLEIISYNDAAGRFEFQVVENYTEHGSPQARPANRVMCMSCHHNAAPIFPATPWSETSFNVEIASRLVAALPGRYRSLIEVLTLDAGVIDVLSERANYLAATQIVWRRGCSSTACRAAMLGAALQYRLSGESSFDQDSPEYRNDYQVELARNWGRHWPGGLALAGSRLSDRNPFSDAGHSRRHDPLLPRAAQATWQQVDPILARGIIYRLAGFFTLADIRRIDQWLIATSKRSPPSVYRYTASCQARRQDANVYRLACGENSGPERLQAKLEVEVSGQEVDSLRVLSLKIPLDSNLLQPDIIELRAFPGRLEAVPGVDRGRLSQRLVNGDRIDSISLHWNDSLLSGASRLGVEIASEYGIIDGALRQMLADQETGAGSSLTTGVFRRKSVMQELMRALGMPPLEWRPTGSTVPGQRAVTATGLNGGLALLQPYCGHCHSDASLNPPGFLAGPAAAENILQCAPRILARLRAWQPESGFPRSPMPPPASIEYSGTSSAGWPSSDHYFTLLASLEQLVKDAQGNQRLEQRSRMDYDQLPPCLASVDASE